MLLLASFIGVAGATDEQVLVVDIDTLPVEVHGEQPGSAWYGYYHRRVYHPIVASAGETGDILDLRLREGQVQTAVWSSCWSLRGLAERVLRTPARFTVSGRRITMTTGGASAYWRMLVRGLATLQGPSG